MWQSSDVAKIAMVSPAQLREWARREIVSPDVAGRGSGHPALYGWQAVLVVSVIAELRRTFGIELGRWSERARTARRAIDQHSFIRLWGSSLIFGVDDMAELVWASINETSPMMRVALDPHLSRLAYEMQLPGPPSQLPLIAPIGARG